MTCEYKLPNWRLQQIFPIAARVISTTFCVRTVLFICILLVLSSVSTYLNNPQLPILARYHKVYQTLYKFPSRSRSTSSITYITSAVFRKYIFDTPQATQISLRIQMLTHLHRNSDLCHPLPISNNAHSFYFMDRKGFFVAPPYLVILETISSSWKTTAPIYIPKTIF